MKLLLHTCCGPCFLGVWEDLKDRDFEVTNYFYNPNIWPEEEYQKRKTNLQKVVKIAKTKLIEEGYQPNEYAVAVKGKETLFPDRCLECYKVRLNKTAEYAKNNGFDSFSTTLLVSPYQNHEALIETGRLLSKKYRINFLEADWRPYFREGQSLAKEKEIYRQKYCGCQHSFCEQASRVQEKGV